jgi:hypothetical protein
LDLSLEIKKVKNIGIYSDTRGVKKLLEGEGKKVGFPAHSKEIKWLQK